LLAAATAIRTTIEIIIALQSLHCRERARKESKRSFSSKMVMV
jgi:hypothetical protein